MISCIHNGSIERLPAIRPQLQRMARELEADLREVHWQPAIESARYGLFRRFISNRSANRAHRSDLRFRDSS